MYGGRKHRPTKALKYINYLLIIPEAFNQGLKKALRFARAFLCVFSFLFQVQMGLDAFPVRFAAGFIRSMKNSNQNTSQIRHPLFVSPRGLDQAARMSGEYFAEKMNRHGQVLFVGGLMEVKGEDGASGKRELTLNSWDFGSQRV